MKAITAWWESSGADARRIRPLRRAADLIQQRDALAAPAEGVRTSNSVATRFSDGVTAGSADIAVATTWDVDRASGSRRRGGSRLPWCRPQSGLLALCPPTCKRLRQI